MLDDLAQIANLDKQNILGSIEHLPEQISQAWDEVNRIDFPGEYSTVSNIVVCGMGGSGLGALILKHLLFSHMGTLFESVHGYFLPNYVGESSLVILSSYSGNTEEVLSAFHDAVKRKAKIIGIAADGKLLDGLEKEGLPYYKIDPINNPSGQPRMSLGYSVASILAILTKLKYLSVHESYIDELIAVSNKFVREFGVRVHSEKNEAKKLAIKLSSKALVLISSEHLIGVAHAFKNQVNENAKNLAFGFTISESNHHLMEGLRFPAKAKEFVRFLFIESKNYYERDLKRYEITQDIVGQNGYGFDIYKTVSQKRHEEVFEVLVLGSYVSFYMAMLHNIDPAPIPWVDYFKEKME